MNSLMGKKDVKKSSHVFIKHLMRDFCSRYFAFFSTRRRTGKNLVRDPFNRNNKNGGKGGQVRSFYQDIKKYFSMALPLWEVLSNESSRWANTGRDWRLAPSVAFFKAKGKVYYYYKNIQTFTVSLFRGDQQGSLATDVIFTWLKVQILTG